MAGRKRPSQRVEPRFEGSAQPSHSAELRVSPRDRAAKPGPKSAAKSATNGSSNRRILNKKSNAKTKRQKRGGLLGFLRSVTYWSFVLGIWGGIAITGLVAYYGVKLPSASDWSIPQRPPNAKIVSVDGELIANRGLTGGSAIALDDMSPYLPMAVVAIEDRRFKSHFGIDPLGITRAMIANILAGRTVQGGSTLTQQLAKNLFLEPQRNLERKVQEAILAIWLENKFSKDEILEIYLNRVYFGSGAYGVEAAARRYFSKSARDVNLAEAALLAGLLKAPSSLSPARNPKGAEDRAQVVLAAMRRSGFVTDSEVATALSMEAKKAKRFWSGSEHYAADFVMQQLPSLIGEMREDVFVDTTIDLTLQKQGGSLIKQTLEDNQKRFNVSQGALVSMDGTGAIRALVGGAEYADSQYNRAVDAKRQPGSAFKPIVYLAALENGFTPDTVRVDRPVAIGSWKPENYDKKYRGPVTLSEALSWSLNTIAAQLVSEIGAGAVIDTAKSVGITSKLSRNASIALGTSEVSLLELTSAYAPFANGGYLAQPFIIKRVTTLDGKVLYDRNATNAPKVLGSDQVSMMNQMLRRVVSEGTGKAAKIDGWQIAGKTGTTQGFKDALFVGYSANLITGVWYGNDDGAPMKKVTGGGLPAKTFASFMGTAHQGVPVASLPGYYVPKEIDIVPTPSPRGYENEQFNNPRPQGQLAATQSSVRDPNQRRPLSTLTTGTPKPAADLGSNQNRQKPKSIIELLLGN
ncbi:MAG: transglycosylase domain-containing protein [Salaquimonas sp.]